MTEIRDVVIADFDAIKNGMLISEVSGVQKYENGKATGEIIGYKATFLVTTEKSKGLQIVVKLATTEKPKWKMMDYYAFDFDKEKSSVYINNNRLALSLWANQVVEI